MTGRARPTSGLDAVVGRWRTHGHVLGADPVPVRGTDTYELLDGGHFLIHHVDVQVGSQPVRAIEIIGEPDTESGELIARSYDNIGATAIMWLRIEDAVWHFRGGADIAAAAQTTPQNPSGGAVRSTLRIGVDGLSMTALWERAGDGLTWQPWMDISFTLDPVCRPA